MLSKGILPFIGDTLIVFAIMNFINFLVPNSIASSVQIYLTLITVCTLDEAIETLKTKRRDSIWWSKPAGLGAGSGFFLFTIHKSYTSLLHIAPLVIIALTTTIIVHHIAKRIYAQRLP